MTAGDVVNETGVDLQCFGKFCQREDRTHILFATLPVTTIRWIELQDAANLLVIDLFIATLVHQHLLAKLKELDRIWKLLCF